MIDINRIPREGGSLYTAPVQKAFELLYLEVVIKHGEASPEAAEAREKYLHVGEFLQIEKPIESPEGLLCCVANTQAGFARTDVLVEPMPFNKLMYTIDSVPNFRAFRERVAFEKRDMMLWLENEGRVVMSIKANEDPVSFAYSFAVGLRVDGASLKTATGDIELNGSYQITVRDRIIQEKSAVIHVVMYDEEGELLDNTKRPVVEEVAAIDSFVKNRNPYWVGMKASLDARLAKLEENDPGLELTISKERYLPLTASDPDHMLSVGGIDVIVARKTGFMRVGVDVSKITFDQVIKGLEVKTVEVESILPISQHIDVGYVNALYHDETGYGLRIQGVHPVKEIVSLLGGISFESIKLERYPSPGFDKNYVTGMVHIADPCFGSISIPVFDMSVVRKIIEETEIVVYPERDIRVFREGDDQDLFSFTIVNYDPEKDGLLRTETSVIQGNEQVESVKDNYVLETTVNYKATASTRFKFNVDPQAEMTVVSKLYLEKDGVSRLLTTVELPRVYAIVDKNRFTITGMDHIGGTTTCYLQFSDYEKVRKLEKEDLLSLQVSTTTGLTVTQDEQFGYDEDLGVGTFTGYHPDYKGTTMLVKNLGRRVKTPVSLRLPYKPQDFEVKQTSAVMLSRRLHVEFVVTATQFPTSIEINELDQVQTDKWCSFTRGNADINIENQKVSFILDFAADAWIQDDIEVHYIPTMLLRTPAMNSNGVGVSGEGTYLLDKTNYDLVITEIRHTYDRLTGIAELLYKVRSRTDKIVKDLRPENIQYKSGETLKNPTLVNYDNNTGTMRMLFRPSVETFHDTPITIAMDVNDGVRYYGAMTYETVIETLVKLQVSILDPVFELEVAKPTITWRYEVATPAAGIWDVTSMAMPAKATAGMVGNSLNAISQTYNPVTRRGEVVYEIVTDELNNITYRTNGKMEGENNGVIFTQDISFEYMLPATGGFKISPEPMKLVGRAVTQDFQISNKKGDLATRAEILKFAAVQGVQGGKNTPDSELFDQTAQRYRFTATTVERPEAPLEIGFQGEMFVDDIPLPFNLKKIVPYLRIKQNSEKMVGDRATATAVLYDTEGKNIPGEVVFHMLSMTNKADEPDFKFKRIGASSEWELSAVGKIDNTKLLTYDFTIDAQTDVDGVLVTIPGTLHVSGEYDVPEGESVTATQKDFTLTTETASVTLGLTFKDGSFPMAAKLNTAFTIHTGTKPGVNAPKAWDYNPVNGELVFVWDIVDVPGTRYTFASKIEFPAYPAVAAVPFEVEKSSDPLPVPLTITRKSETLVGNTVEIVNVIKQTDGKFVPDLELVIPFKSVLGSANSTRTPKAFNYNPVNGELTYSFDMVLPLREATFNYDVKSKKLYDHVQNVTDVASTIIVVEKVYSHVFVDKYLDGDTLYGVYDFLVDGQAADGIAQYALISGGELANEPDFKATQSETQVNRVTFSAKVNMPTQPDQWLDYSMKIEATLPDDKREIITVNASGEKWEPPVGEDGKTDPSIKLHSFVIKDGNAIVEYDLAMADGSFPVGAKFVLPLEIATPTTGPLDPQNAIYNPRTGVAKFTIPVVVDPTKEMTYHFAGNITLWPYNGDLALHFDNQLKVAASKGPLTVSNVKLDVAGEVGTLSMKVAYSDGAIAEEVTLVTPVEKVTNTKDGTKNLTNIKYDKVTGVITANIAVVRASAGGTNYLVGGKVYPSASGNDTSSYEATTTAVPEYHIEWDAPVWTKKLITHTGKVVVSPNAADPTSVTILAITNAIGLVGANPRTQNYDPVTKIVTYTAEAKELTVVPVLYKYTVTSDIDGVQQSVNVDRTINPLSPVSTTPVYNNGVLTIDYDFYDNSVPSPLDITADLVGFTISPGATPYTPEWTWERKANPLPGRFTWTATFKVPLHTSPSSRWDWDLLFKYKIDNTLSAEVPMKGYTQVTTVNGGTAIFQNTPATEQKGTPVGGRPVMYTTWKVNCLDSVGNKPLFAELVGAISGSNTASNGVIESQSYDPETGILTILNTYYGDATAAINISATGTIRHKVPTGYETARVTAGAYTIPKPTPFTVTEVKDKLSADRKELTISFKLVPENGVYPLHATMKIPFTVAPKTLGGTRQPKNLGTAEAPRYYDYDPATGVCSFTFPMAATIIDGESLRFTTDLWGKLGNVYQNVNFDIMVNSDNVWMSTHKRTEVNLRDIEVTYNLARPNGSLATTATVTGFDTPAGILTTVSGVEYNPATGDIKFHATLAADLVSAVTKATINPIFQVDGQEWKVKLSHDLYNYVMVQTSADYTPGTKVIRAFNTVKRQNDSSDVANGVYRRTKSDPAATGAVVTSKVTGTPLKWGAEWPVVGAKTDDKTVFSYEGDFLINHGGNLYQAVPWKNSTTVFLNAPSYINSARRDAVLKGNELTIRMDTSWGGVAGHPVGTAISTKPFSSALPDGNSNKTPLRESFDSDTGIYTFVFKVDPTFANNGGYFSYDTRLAFPAYGDNVSKPGIDTRITTNGNVLPTPPVVYTASLDSAVITGNTLVENVKFVNKDGNFPNALSELTVTLTEGAILDVANPAVYDKTTGLLKTTYICSVPTDLIPVTVKTGYTAKAGNEDGSASVYSGTYTHELYKVTSTNADLQAKTLVLDHKVTVSNKAIDNLVLATVSYSNSQGNGSLLPHTAGDLIWKLNLPNNGNRPFNTVGSGNYTRDLGNKVIVNIPFTVEYNQPLTPEVGATAQTFEVNKFTQQVNLSVAGVPPATASIKTFTPTKGFLANSSNQLTQSYDPATGVLTWSALTVTPAGNFYIDLEGTLTIDYGNSITKDHTVKHKLNVYWLREYSTGWLNGNLQRVWYLTMNGGSNVGRPGVFIARNFAPANSGKSFGTSHSGSDVDWKMITNAADPALDKNTVYNGDGVLQITELDGLTVNIPWTFTYTNVPPKSPYSATLNKVSLKDDVATLTYTLKNTTNDFPASATMTKMTTSQGALANTLDVKSQSYDPATGTYILKFDAAKVPVDLSMLIGCTGSVKTELVDPVLLSGTRRAWYYNATTTNYRWMANNLVADHNLLPGANSAMPVQCDYTIGQLTNGVAGTNRSVIEHLNNQSVFTGTHAVLPPQAAGTQYKGTGYLIVPGNSENAESHIKFDIDHTATAIPVRAERNVELYDVNWSGGKVNFLIMCKEADGSFSPTVTLGPTVTRVYTPNRQDGAAVENESYNPATGILTATFSGPGPNTTPSDFQVNGTFKYPSAQTLGGIVNRVLDNRAFAGGIHHA